MKAEKSTLLICSLNIWENVSTGLLSDLPESVSQHVHGMSWRWSSASGSKASQLPDFYVFLIMLLKYGEIDFLIKFCIIIISDMDIFPCV